MGIIIYEDDISPIEVGGERFDLKRKMSHGDYRTLENEFIALATKLQKGDVPIGAGIPTLLLLNIKGWSLLDRKDNLLEITAENINRLDNDVVSEIIEEVNKRNPPPKAVNLSRKFGLP